MDNLVSTSYVVINLGKRSSCMTASNLKRVLESTSKNYGSSLISGKVSKSAVWIAKNVNNLL